MATVRTVTVKSSGGDYASLNAALSGESGDLVYLDRELHINCYGFEDTAPATTGTGYTTDATRFIQISIPTAERHNGTSAAISGRNNYRLNTAASDANALGINEQYTVCDGLEILGWNGYAGWNSRYAIHASGCDYSTFRNNLIHDSGNDAHGVQHGIYIYAVQCSWINNIGYNISGSFMTTASGYQTGQKIYNNTAWNYNTRSGGTRPGMSIGASDTPNQLIKNNLVIAGANGGACYSFGANVTLATNGSSDATGTAGLQSLTAANLFVSVTGAAENLHLKAGAAALNVGTDLSAIFTTDIDGDTRPTGANTWDIGADELAAGGSPIGKRTGAAWASVDRASIY